ncbi:hypothetical protein QYE76_049888 [Lolium multiflorum]|uniref:Uncharacterized protein n=1 Tax=Lolium multiflorum TaxID=4521 RepID=A0AAD8SPY2_LOLMU|nr:hypothetical protein QYE76_049888 [Lolium multiflorum]
MRGLRLWGVLSGEVSCPPRPVAPTAPTAPTPVGLAPAATQADKDAATSADDTALADYDRKVQGHSTRVAFTEFGQRRAQLIARGRVPLSEVLAELCAEETRLRGAGLLEVPSVLVARGPPVPSARGPPTPSTSMRSPAPPILSIPPVQGQSGLELVEKYIQDLLARAAVGD